ncbi:MAG TPA: hypothetical protein VIQ54_08370 [Polyangia bacterium]
MKTRALALVLAVGCLAAAACEEPRPTFADPGAPFHSLVASDRVISSLNAAEVHVLCDELAKANDQFLLDAIVEETSCRDRGHLYGADPPVAGTDPKAACEAEYRDCKAEKAASPPDWYCPLPSPACNASVNELSACLNALAAAFPVAACVSVPDCDGVLPTAPPNRDVLPDACVAFNRDCPVAGLDQGFLCAGRDFAP